MKKLLTIIIFSLIVGCSGTSTKPESKGCDRPNPKGEGHSWYGVPPLWSC
jgi:hypothetical protein